MTSPWRRWVLVKWLFYWSSWKRRLYSVNPCGPGTWNSAQNQEVPWQMFDLWMDGWMDAWMGGWMNKRRMNKWLGQTHARIDGQLNVRQRKSRKMQDKMYLRAMWNDAGPGMSEGLFSACMWKCRGLGDCVCWEEIAW